MKSSASKLEALDMARGMQERKPPSTFDVHRSRSDLSSAASKKGQREAKRRRAKTELLRAVSSVRPSELGRG